MVDLLPQSHLVNRGFYSEWETDETAEELAEREEHEAFQAAFRQQNEAREEAEREKARALAQVEATHSNPLADIEQSFTRLLALAKQQAGELSALRAQRKPEAEPIAAQPVAAPAASVTSLSELPVRVKPSFRILERDPNGAAVAFEAEHAGQMHRLGVASRDAGGNIASVNTELGRFHVVRNRQGDVAELRAAA